jgi:F-type H+-transporting ATPase subunit epsilon
MAELACEILTPEGRVFSGNAQMVSVPGVEGELGVLPRHASIVARLKAGEVRVRFESGETRSFAISEGYFKMQRDRALVLVEGAVAAEDIDLEAVRVEAEDARARLAAADGGDESIDRFRAERDLAAAENKLKIAGR